MSNLTNSEIRNGLKQLGVSQFKVGTYTPFADESGPVKVRRVTITHSQDKGVVSEFIGQNLHWCSIGNDRQGCTKGWAADIS